MCYSGQKAHHPALLSQPIYIKKEINVIIEKIVLSSIAHTSINSEDRPEFFSIAVAGVVCTGLGDS